MRRALAIAGLSAVVALVGCGGDSGESSAGCSTEPDGSTEDVVFRLLPGAEAVSPATRAEAMAFACRRLQAYDLDGRVEAAGRDRIKIVAERGAGGGEGEKTPLQAIAIPGALRIYDWEANLVGSPRGYDSAVEAARVGARLEPVEPCTQCVSSVPLYFHFSEFDADGKPELSEGGTPARAPLGPDGSPIPSTGPVVEIPVGTLLVTEEADGGKPRWYVLRDRAAVTEDEVSGARAGVDEVTGEAALTLDLLPSGRQDFREMTKRVAARPGHFAVLFGNSYVITRPRLDPSVAGRGIDASRGVQITGVFETLDEAQEATRLTDIGAAPVVLEPLRGSAGY